MRKYFDGNSMKNWVLLVFCVLLSSGTALGQLASEPVLTAYPKDFRSLSSFVLAPDAPLVTFKVKGENRWILSLWNKTHGGIDQMVSRGSTDRPISGLIRIDPQRKFFKYDRARFAGNFWVMNTYQADSGILAFIHVENSEGSMQSSMRGKHTTGKSRIGLAWSSNDGESFQYLGHIIIPFGDPDPFNVQGLPYLVIDGYFYIYFHDKAGFSVARAQVAEVIDAAIEGRITSWQKYAGPSEGFNSQGLGGKSKRLGIDGISHSDAACSTYNDKCYLVLTRMNWFGEDTWIKMFETVDGVNWKQVLTIALESASAVTQGYQYATITDQYGNDNGMVGKRFFVYSLKDPGKPACALFRWEVEIEN